MNAEQTMRWLLDGGCVQLRLVNGNLQVVEPACPNGAPADLNAVGYQPCQRPGSFSWAVKRAYGGALVRRKVWKLRKAVGYHTLSAYPWHRRSLDALDWEVAS